MRNVRWWGWALLLVVGAGCAYERTARTPDFSPATLGRVAVVPFENLAAYPNAGVIVADLFQAELYTVRSLDLVPADEISRALGEREGERVETAKLGELLKADTLVLGRVTEYTYKAGLGEDPAIGISIRVVDARTGRVLWSGARSQTGRYSWVKEDSLSRLAQAVCHQLARAMLENCADGGR